MYTKDWHLFGWISLGMGCIGLVICPFLPESARWLVSQGKCEEATKVLVKMAKENGKDGNKDIIGGDVKYLVDENKTVPKGSLRTIFSNGRLCFNFIMLTICISTSTFMLDMTYLNATHMGGYKFLNVIILFAAGFAGGSVGGLFMIVWAKMRRPLQQSGTNFFLLLFVHRLQDSLSL
ncbi:Solute carrier family 22 member 16 [Orchesella cincta]|uniref:Solute carrier family 22 member 16 n=1 Tax=Orchesella cincta TaxID=48709 RepID=A0A1D2MHZ0_ORCCI|nr:Solute carrier family 22 member 16 [Orchesella cincta]